MTIEQFDDIRPYNASEIPAAMRRIAASEYLPKLSRFIFPERDVEDVRRMVAAISSTYEFQEKVMYHFNARVIKNSMTELTYSGLERLDKTKNYLFISNHRDIVLDSSLLQYILFDNGFRTTEITFGSNLMHPQLVVDIGKSNKMFRVERSSNIRDFLKNSHHLSDYIRFTIKEKGESVWIAQRNGRTKDGNDATDRGIIKMFCMSDVKDLRRSVAELNIVPVAVSYQIESCDFLKAKELYLSQRVEKYVKQPGEDLHSILTGIMQPKGAVNISICKPLEYGDYEFDFVSPNEFYKKVASLIDKTIYANYKLFDFNYIAAQQIVSLQDAKEIVSLQERLSLPAEAVGEFAKRVEKAVEQLSDSIAGSNTIASRGSNTLVSDIASLFLKIYANPVINSLKIK
jgi:1-acyl-sn-glycerol-3-phosphate acyltransferase